MYVPTPAFLDAALTCLLAGTTPPPGPGPLEGCSVSLSTSAIETGVDVDYATVITPPTYTGYAPLPVVWGKPHKDADGTLAVDGGLLTFQPTDAVSASLIAGYAIHLTAGAKTIMLVENFATPVNLANALTALAFVPHFRFGLTDTGEGIIMP